MDFEASSLLLPAFRADRASATPIFRQVAQFIETAARDASAEPSTRLPSEEALTDALGVNRGTVRRALRDLASNGVVVQVHGRGTFLTERRVLEQPLASSLISFSEALEAAGVAFTTELISRAQIRPDLALSQRLGTTESVNAFRRLRRVDGVPAILLDNFMPASLFADLQERDLAGRQLFAVLAEDYGRAPFDGTRTFEATLAQADIATLLEISVGAPVMYAEQTTRDSTGVPIEASNMWFPGRRFRLFAQLLRNSANDPADRRRG